MSDRTMTTLLTDFDLFPADDDNETVTVLWDEDASDLLLRWNDDGEIESAGINLTAHGFVAEPGTVFVKDEAPYAGMTSRLAKLGVLNIEQEVAYGSWHVTAHQIRPLRPSDDS